MRVSLLAVPILIIALVAAENEVGFCENAGSGSQTVGVNWRGVASSVISVIPIEGVPLVGAFFSVLAQIGVSGFSPLVMLIFSDCLCIFVLHFRLKKLTTASTWTN